MLSRRTFLRTASTAMAASAALARTGRAQASKSAVVIGAGIAGLGAARELHRAGWNVTVLEARDRIGGRIWTHRGLGYPVDLGAAWIHGHRRNPITELAEEFSVKTFETVYESVATYTHEGNSLGLLDLMRNEAAYQLLKRSALGRDMTLMKAFEEVAKGKDIANNALWRLATDSLDIGDHPKHLHAKYVDDDDEFGGKQLMFPEGYAQIPVRLATGLDVRTEMPVSRIAWSDAGVEVAANDQTFTADAAVVTLPLGVLQANAVQFEPALPDAKQKAIKGLGMGLLNKVLLKFPEAFWDDKHSIGHVGDYANGTPLGRYPIMFNLAVLPDKRPILMVLAHGDFGRALEEQSNEDTVSEIMDLLKTIYGKTIPDPDDSVHSAWHTDPFSRGAYASVAPNGTNDDFDRLAAPAKRLIFAGEATNRQYRGTVHGAYLSGLRAARTVQNL